MNDNRKNYVYFDHNTQAPETLGVFTVQQVRGKELFSFEFDIDWLRKHPEHNLDPDLQLYAGAQFAPKNNFGLFMDSAF